VGTAGALGVLTVLQCRAMPTWAEQAGLRLEDVPRASLAQLVRQHRLDAPIRAALIDNPDRVRRRD